MSLLEQRARVLAEHAAAQKYDPYWIAEARDGRPIAERPVAFLLDDEVAVVGPDVATVLAGLRTFTADLAGRMSDIERAEAVPVFVRHAYYRAKKLIEKHNGDAPAMLRFGQQHWNSILCGLEHAHVLVALTAGESDV